MKAMGFSIENGDEKSAIVPVKASLPVLPREEARRYRQAAREMADVLMPTAMKRLAMMIEAEDADVALRAIKEITRIAMSSRSNEDLDPNDVIDGKVVGRDPVADLEKQTEQDLKGSGSDE